MPQGRRPMTLSGTTSPCSRKLCITSCGPCRTAASPEASVRWKGSASIHTNWSMKKEKALSSVSTGNRCTGKNPWCGDEAQVLTGRDPDFHRKDLWQSIEAGDYPEYELGLQLIPEEDADQFDFDILDATKLIPEALVPVEIVGKMVLNRNPDNFLPKRNRLPSVPPTLCPALTFPTIRCSRAVFSLTAIPSGTGWEEPTSRKFPSTAPFAPSTTIRGTASTACR